MDFVINLVSINTVMQEVFQSNCHFKKLVSEEELLGLISNSFLYGKFT